MGCGLCGGPCCGPYVPRVSIVSKPDMGAQDVSAIHEFSGLEQPWTECVV